MSDASLPHCDECGRVEHDCACRSEDDGPLLVEYCHPPIPAALQWGFPGPICPDVAAGELPYGELMPRVTLLSP
jgi:hypothetical protein